VCRDFTHHVAVTDGVSAQSLSAIFGDIDPLVEAAAAKAAAAIFAVLAL
jgi:hypothetical protein